ncbi:MAG: helix-turn-helix transcriptional regulator [Luteolibacter sp.]
MQKSIHSSFAKAICDHLKKLREEAGMTQRDLASALKREHGMVARMELGERRVDLAEAYWVFHALRTDPAVEVSKLMRRFEEIAGEEAKEGG